MGILDTIIHTKQADSLKEFRPSDIVKDILSSLKERDRLILVHRYGLSGNQIKTLAAIGSEQGLTRERVRQIEKELLKQLSRKGVDKALYRMAKELLLNTVTEHGRIMAQDTLLETMGIKNEEDRNSIIFLLHLMEELEDYLHANYKKCWTTILFNKQLLFDFNEESKNMLSQAGRPIANQEFIEKFKETELYKRHEQEFTDKVILNFLDLAHEVERNVFEQWGLAAWKEISPKDVGDKAYLVMKYHGKPEHYSAITEMINKAKFDGRTAYKETVHNELIKDSRFILIGRGIYALSEWGYKPGVVSDVIAEVLKNTPAPVTREKIIEEVLKRRVVKKNTILVGLSNKKMFKKVGKNTYSLA